MIEAAGLRKSFGDRVVLDGVDLDVAEGTLFALLGPNGAGKTTLVRILSGLIGADAGEARVAGHDLAREPEAVRAAVGVMGRLPAVRDRLTGHAELALMAERLALGRPAADPRLLFLDEPTAGLDPRARRTIWEDVRRLVANGVTVFLTTQYLEEADLLADRIAVLHGGRLVAEGTADDLKRLVPGARFRLEFSGPGELESAARRLGAVVRDDEELALEIPSDGSLHSLQSMLDRLEGDEIAVAALSVHTPDLDDVFLALTER